TRLHRPAAWEPAAPPVTVSSLFSGHSAPRGTRTTAPERRHYPAPEGAVPACRSRGAYAARRLATMLVRPLRRQYRCAESGARILLRRFEHRLSRLRRLDLRDLLFDQLDQMVDDAGIPQPVVGDAAEIDLMRVVAAAGEADIGLARLAGPVDN